MISLKLFLKNVGIPIGNISTTVCMDMAVGCLLDGYGGEVMIIFGGF